MTIEYDARHFSRAHPEIAGCQQGRRSKASMRLYLYCGLLMLDAAVIAGLPFLLGTLFAGIAPWQGIAPVVAALPVYLVLAVNSRAYSPDTLRLPGESVRRAITSLIVAQLSVFTVMFFLGETQAVSPLTFGLGLAIVLACLALLRAIYCQFALRIVGSRLMDELILLDGVRPPVSSRGIEMMRAADLQLRPDLRDPVMLDRFGRLAEKYDRILIASVPEHQLNWSLLLKGADVDGEIITEQASAVGAIGVGKMRELDTLLVSRRRLGPIDRAKKRLLDLAITIPVLLLCLPLMAIVALAIRLEGRGPILFKQDRVGQGNRLFKVLKFRTMRADRCDHAGSRSASRDDDRITTIGRFLRATSIDELPQLFNVLLGDMSLVGPRPHALGSLAGDRLFWEVDATYWHRHQLKPGITGLAQIRGLRGATLETLDLTRRLQADMEYVQGWNIWRDLIILLATFRVVVHKNAF